MPLADDLDRQLLLAIVSQVPGYDIVRLVDLEKIAQMASRVVFDSQLHTLI